jgi:thioredoxin reductase
LDITTDRWGAASVPQVWGCGVVSGWPSQAVEGASSGAAVAIEIATSAKGECRVDHGDTRIVADAQ